MLEIYECYTKINILQNIKTSGYKLNNTSIQGSRQKNPMNRGIKSQRKDTITWGIAL